MWYCHRPNVPVNVWKNIFSCPGTVYLGTVRAVWWLGKESRVCQKVGAESSFFYFIWRVSMEQAGGNH